MGEREIRPRHTGCVFYLDRLCWISNGPLNSGASPIFFLQLSSFKIFVQNFSPIVSMDTKCFSFQNLFFGKNSVLFDAFAHSRKTPMCFLKDSLFQPVMGADLNLLLGSIGFPQPLIRCRPDRRLGSMEEIYNILQRKLGQEKEREQLLD